MSSRSLLHFQLLSELFLVVVGVDGGDYACTRCAPLPLLLLAETSGHSTVPWRIDHFLLLP